MSNELDALAKATEKVAKWGRTADDYLALLSAAEKAIGAGESPDGEPLSKAREALAGLIKKQPKAGEKTCWLPDDPFLPTEARTTLDKAHAALSAAEKDWSRWKNADNTAQAVGKVKSMLEGLGASASHPAASRISEKLTAICSELGDVPSASDSSPVKAESGEPASNRVSDAAAALEAAKAAAALGPYFDDESRMARIVFSTDAISPRLFERDEPADVAEAREALMGIATSVVPRAESDLASMLAALGCGVEEARGRVRKIADLVDDNDLREALQLAPYRIERLAALKNRLDELVGAALDLLVDRGERYLSGGSLKQAREAIETLVAIAPYEERGQTLKARVDQAETDSVSDRERSTDEANWPAEYSAFAGPGDPKALVASALAWLNSRGAPDGPCTHVTASIAGDWWSVKQNVLGQTIQWALPLNVAIKKDHGRWKGQDVAIVFNMSVLTEEREGVEKTPPWAGTAVGDSFEMRLSKLLPPV